MVHPKSQPDKETQQQTDTCNSRQTVIKQQYINNVIRSTTAPGSIHQPSQMQTYTCNSRQTVIKQQYTNIVIRSTTAPRSIHQDSQMKKLSSRLTPVTGDKQSLNSTIMLSDPLQHHSPSTSPAR